MFEDQIMNPDKLLEVIQQCYENEHFSNEDYQTIRAKHQLLSFEKGDFILKEGKNLNDYYILLEGVVRSFVNNAKGDQITIELFQSGDVVIDVNALFQHKKTLENWECITDCHLLVINFEDFQQLFHTLYGFREWGRTWMSNALFEMKERSIEMLTLPAIERYIHLMEQKPFILHQVPLKYIASYLGVTDTSLSRIRKDYKNLRK